MFEIYKHSFELDGQKYVIIPASGEHLGLLYEVLGKLQNTDKDNFNLDAQTTEALLKYTLEVFKKSYPEIDVKTLELFVSQNLLRLLEPIIKVSLRQ